jgi:hypothetical protein
MANPTRFPSGLSTFKTNHVLNTFPTLPANNQLGVTTQEYTPYIAGAYTVTSTTATVGAGVWNAVGAALTSGYNSGILSMAVTTAAGGLAGVALNGNVATCQPVTFIPGNQTWFNAQIACNKSLIGSYAADGTTLSAGDATSVIRVGLISNADPTAAAASITDGIFFELPATKNATASAMNLVIKNKGLTGAQVTTTINNICDLARPSGIFGDTSSFGGDPVAALTTTGAANKFTAISVAQPGSGYSQAPLVRLTGTAAAAPFAQAYCQIGAQAQQNSLPGNMGNLGGGFLYAPYLCHVGGVGYTTFTSEVNHWIDLSLYYNGKGQLFVGVNGKLVATVGQLPMNAGGGTQVTNLAAGGTATSGNQFYVTNAAMTSSIAPITPTAGTVDLIMPMSPLNAAVGYFANTAATNILFLDNLQCGSEYN